MNTGGCGRKIEINMVFLFGLLIFFAAFAFVAYPLVVARRQESVLEDELESELQFKKESTYSALKELEFDYALGNLSPEDHRDLEDRYKEKAINILKELDGLEVKPSANGVSSAADVDDLEKEIFLARKGKQDGLEDEIKAARKSRRPEAIHREESALVTCPTCNRQAASTARFCPSCGAALSLSCPSCKKPVKKGEKFCSGCGAKLT